MKNGDLVVKYFPYAMRIAGTFKGGDTDVLQGAALDGLMDAAQRYDGSRYESQHFMTFARQRIAGAIIDVRVKTIGKQKEPRRFFPVTEENGGSYDMMGLGFDLPMAHVSPREKSILRMLFVLDMTQAEVAREIGRAECRVFQLKRQAFVKIKANLAARGITRLDQII